MVGHKIDFPTDPVNTNSGVYAAIGKSIHVTFCLYSRHRLAGIKPDWHFHQPGAFHVDLMRKVAMAHKSQVSGHWVSEIRKLLETLTPSLDCPLPRIP